MYGATLPKQVLIITYLEHCGSLVTHNESEVYELEIALDAQAVTVDVSNASKEARKSHRVPHFGRGSYTLYNDFWSHRFGIEWTRDEVVVVTQSHKGVEFA